jgi:phage terminase small subunit
MGEKTDHQLNPRQQRFVEEYLIDSIAKQAAIRAGYSKKTAEAIGHRLLRDVKVKAAIDAGRANLSQKAMRTTLDILADLQAIRDDAMRVAADATGRKAMASRQDALKALDQESRILGAYERDNQQTRPATAVILEVTGVKPA